MNEFEPSRDFTEKVMKAVYDFEASKKGGHAGLRDVLSVRLIGYGLPVGGAVLAIINIVRLCFTYLAPAVCH
jgi:hypothetical protein